MRKNPSGIQRNLTHNDRPFQRFPLQDADLCVKCALCLPHCPTYKLSRHEGDSPRGRIALMQGLAQDVISHESTASAHLDGCLVCRACEPVCPAEVPYGRLIDSGREGLWNAGHRPGRFWRVLAWWRQTPMRLRALGAFIRMLYRSGLAALVARLPLGRLSRSATFIERAGSPPGFGRHSPVNETDESVALFLGCIARPLDATVLHASVRVLNAMSFAVDVPSTQSCCGAMDTHAGHRAAAAKLAATNIDAFSGAEAIISTASGCGVQLLDYRELGEIDNAATNAFSARVHDVMHFVSQHVDRLPALHHTQARVLVHTPCTLKNGLRQHGAQAVLERISGISVEPFDYQDCCGAAGTYLFEHAGSADALGARLLDALEKHEADIFVTGNIGCALHVRRLVRERGLALRICHPVELLAASLPDSSGY